MPSAKISFPAQPRVILGKKSKTIRQQAGVPANVSGDLEKPIPVTISQIAFSRLYDKVGDTGLFYLEIEGEKEGRPVLVNEIQRDPVSGQVLHVVFRQVNLSEKVEAEVPVEVVGEFKVKNALVVTVHDAIKVEALPQDLPEKFVVDVSGFTEFGQMVTFSQLDYDRAKVTLVVETEELETPVVIVEEVKEEVEEVPVVAPVEGAEGALVEGAVAEEGAAGAAKGAGEGAATTEKKPAEKKEEKK